MNNPKLSAGQISLQLLVFSTVALSAVIGFVVWSSSLLNSSVRDFRKTIAFNIAEAGIEYYRWHLAHAPLDYQDGTGAPGPYSHDYYDKSGKMIGTFVLDITAPPTGSRVVKIRSTGRLITDSSVEKIIEVRLGIPSLAKYAVAVYSAVRFGTGTEIFGPIHSNNGIRFDGLAHNLITSALTTYDDPDHSGANEYAVHTHVSPIDPLPTSTLSAHADVFMSGRQMGVPALDFVGITQTLSQLSLDAQAGGFYRASSTAFGYELILKTDDTFDLRRVTSLLAASSTCTNSQSQSGWGTWVIGTSTLLGNYAFPANGIIFLGDHIWVRGQINGARLTIASGVFPDDAATRTSITINSDLLYTAYDGSDVIGLIAQNNINTGLGSADTERIDAALIAQNGRAGRYYYGSGCGTGYKRTALTLYGMIASNQRYGFAYTDGTGYTTRNIIYDGNMLFGPPPNFPLTGDQYVQISWDEIK